MASRFTIYYTICSQLDRVDKITEAAECFRQMTGELGGKTNLLAKQAEWTSGEQLYITHGYRRL